MGWSWGRGGYGKGSKGFSRFGRGDEGMGDGGGSGILSHSTVEKLYAWEKKLFLEVKETDGLLQRLKETATHSHPSLSNPTNLSASERIQELQEKIGDSEFDRSLLQIREKIASGSCGDL